MSQTTATVLAASITGAAALTVGVLAYIFGRLQKEHEVRFTRLYGRRAEVVAALYTLLHQLAERYEAWRSNHDYRQTKKRDEQNQLIRDKLDEFQTCYREKDIWISIETFDKAKAFYEEASTKWVQFDRPMTPEQRKKAAEDVSEWVGNNLPKLRDDLKNEFRGVLEIGSAQDDGNPTIKGYWRLAVGVLGVSLFGCGLGLILGYFTGAYKMGIWAGLLVGFGIGLFIEYLRPSRV